MRDRERVVEPDIFPHPWQTDTCVGGWFYDVRQVYKTPSHVITMLVDIVSKNGCMLLNFTQKPDGTLDEECLYILKCMADWIAANGEGVYATRPWKIASEGPARNESKGMREQEVAWTSDDFRFTSKGDAGYAFQMKWPEKGKALVKAFASGEGLKVAGVSLLGREGGLKFSQEPRALVIDLPENEPAREFPICFRVQLEG